MKQKILAYFFIAPALIHLLVFALIPILFAFYISLHKWHLFIPGREFVGFTNYTNIFSNDPVFWNALKNTAVFVALTVPIGIILSLAIASLLNTRIRGTNFFRTIYFLPVVVSTVAISIAWQWTFHLEFGLLNYFLSFFGIQKINWLQSTVGAMLAIVIVTTWKGLGYQIIIFLAGLQGIPQHLYEAAEVDGASRWKRFWRITLPMLRPTLYFLIITSVISSFQVFTVVYMLTQGGPLESTDVVGYHIYKDAFEDYTMGYASAQAFILFAVILVITVIQVKLMSRQYRDLYGELA